MRDSAERLCQHLDSAAKTVLGGVVVGARKPGADLRRLVSTAARQAEGGGADLVVLGQFSLAHATSAARALQDPSLI